MWNWIFLFLAKFKEIEFTSAFSLFSLIVSTKEEYLIVFNISLTIDTSIGIHQTEINHYTDHIPIGIHSFLFYLNIERISYTK